MLFLTIHFFHKLDIIYLAILSNNRNLYFFLIIEKNLDGFIIINIILFVFLEILSKFWF